MILRMFIRRKMLPWEGDQRVVNHVKLTDKLARHFTTFRLITSRNRFGFKLPSPHKSLTSFSPLFIDQPMMSASMCATMDDILVVTTKQSELGILWVNYLKACFDKITKQRGRMPFK